MPVPRKTSLNWFMPALVNSSVGSSSGTTRRRRHDVWPCFLTKKSMNCWRISFAVDMATSRAMQTDIPNKQPQGGLRLENFLDTDRSLYKEVHRPAVGRRRDFPCPVSCRAILETLSRFTLFTRRPPCAISSPSDCCRCVRCFLPVSAQEKKVPAVLNFKMKSLDGKDVDLSQYQGKVVLFVNVASKCGYTPQYKGLQALHEKYARTGLVVLGVPANEFGKQEPGTDAEIAKFCTIEVRREVRHAVQGRRQGRRTRAAVQVPDVEGDRPEVRRRHRSGTSRSS